MPILQPNTTRIASGAAGFTDIYAVSGADAIFDNLDVTGNLEVDGTIEINGVGGAGQAAIINGTTTITRLTDASGVDAYFKVMNFGGEGVGIRANAATGIVRIQPVTNSTTNGPGGLVLQQNGDVQEEGVFTVTRPAGDTTNAGFMSVQNAGGFGMGFRVPAANVAPGASIERVTGTAGSGVADITLGPTGDVTFAQNVAITGTLGVTGAATLSTVNGSVPYTNTTAAFASTSLSAATTIAAPNALSVAIPVVANTAYRVSFRFQAANAVGDGLIGLAVFNVSAPLGTLVAGMGTYQNSIFNAGDGNGLNTASCVFNSGANTSVQVVGFNTSAATATTFTVTNIFVENLGPSIAI